MSLACGVHGAECTGFHTRRGRHQRAPPRQWAALTAAPNRRSPRDQQLYGHLPRMRSGVPSLPPPLADQCRAATGAVVAGFAIDRKKAVSRQLRMALQLVASAQPHRSAPQRGRGSAPRRAGSQSTLQGRLADTGADGQSECSAVGRISRTRPRALMKECPRVPLGGRRPRAVSDGRSSLPAGSARCRL